MSPAPKVFSKARARDDSLLPLLPTIWMPLLALCGICFSSGYLCISPNLNRSGFMACAHLDIADGQLTELADGVGVTQHALLLVP